jgi:hypothetical protein
MDTEMGTTYDSFRVLAEADGTTLELWNKSAAGFSTQKWFEAEVGLGALAGKTVTLRFVFDTNDGVANNGEGVYLDEIAITRGCSAWSCAGAKACDDFVPATKDVCASGSCSYSW